MARYTGTFEPAEFDLVHGVFKRIAGESWFKDDIPTLKQFGLVVIHAYQGGIVDRHELYEYCAQAAKQRFNQTTPAIDID